MKENYTDITVVLDRSGSMQTIHKDMMGGYNRFLAEQKSLDTDTTFTLAQFDNEYEIVHHAIPLKNVPELTDETFVPRGTTALLDALGTTIDLTGERLASMQESDRPSRVVFVIITDGQENASSNFSHQQINEKITHQQEKYNWQFVFLGANQDAIATAAHLGITREKALTYANNSAGAEKMFESLSNRVEAMMSAPVEDTFSFLEEDREEQKRAGLK